MVLEDAGFQVEEQFGVASTAMLNGLFCPDVSVVGRPPAIGTLRTVPAEVVQ